MLLKATFFGLILGGIFVQTADAQDNIVEAFGILAEQDVELARYKTLILGDAAYDTAAVQKLPPAARPAKPAPPPPTASKFVDTDAQFIEILDERPEGAQIIDLGFFCREKGGCIVVKTSSLLNGMQSRHAIQVFEIRKKTATDVSAKLLPPISLYNFLPDKANPPAGVNWKGTNLIQYSFSRRADRAEITAWLFPVVRPADCQNPASLPIVQAYCTFFGAVRQTEAYLVWDAESGKFKWPN